MGLFKKENCILCGEEIKTAGAKLSNNRKLCKDCVRGLNLTTGFNINNVNNSTVEQLRERIEFVKNDLAENSKRISSFHPTMQIGGYIWFDDTNKWFAIPQGTITSSIDKSYVFLYNNIVDFELLEDGASVSKGGLGRAVVGGALFGGVGAIVGATTGKKSNSVCTNLQIKVTTNSSDRPLFYITLINNTSGIKKNGFIYQTAFGNAQQILSKFQTIISELSKEQPIVSNNSAADEIKKYKELLDIGAITKEEFDAKKKELLNL